MMGSIYLEHSAVDTHLISIPSYHTMLMHTVPFPTVGHTPSVRDFVDPCNGVDHSRCVASYHLPPFQHFLYQYTVFSSIAIGGCKRCGGVSMVGSLLSSTFVSPQQPLSGASQSSLNAVSRCCSQYAEVPSGARFTVCMYIERNEYYMTYYNVANRVTVTKQNMIRQNALWIYKNLCCESTARSLLQSGA